MLFIVFFFALSPIPQTLVFYSTTLIQATVFALTHLVFFKFYLPHCLGLATATVLSSGEGQIAGAQEDGLKIEIPPKMIKQTSARIQQKIEIISKTKNIKLSTLLKGPGWVIYRRI